MKALVAGWFSFEGMGATAGDVMARNLVVEWMGEAGIACDIAAVPPFGDHLRWDEAEPDEYRYLVFVCGPFGNGPPVKELLERFQDCRLVGVNLSMLQALEEWQPFDLLFERDSSRTANPDITLAFGGPKVPVVGRILVHAQEEYGERARHAEVERAIDALLQQRETAVVDIDTGLEENAVGLTTPAQVESLIARMDLVITTRLHGTVLALKNGVPVIPIDPIVGGAKIAQQVRTLGWPVLFTPDQLSPADLDKAFDFCSEEKARRQARQCALRARHGVEKVRHDFVAEIKREMTSAS